jgi:hypothetical protein
MIICCLLVDGGRVLLVLVDRKLVLVDGELLLMLAVWQVVMVGVMVKISNIFWLVSWFK